MNSIIVLILAFFLALFFGKEQEPIPPIAHYTIGDVHFAFPTYYRYLSPPTQVESGVILAFLWPSLESRSPKNKKEFSMPGGGKKVMILITPGKPWRGMESRYDFSTKKHVKGNLYSISPPSNIPWDDKQHFVTYPHDPAKRSFIYATTGPSPQCVQRIHYKSVLLEVTYRCIYLDEWEEIQGEIKKMLDEWSKHS